MLDIFKKSLYAGMGALTLTKEKAEKVVAELVEKGEIKAEEAKKAAGELLEKGQQEKAVVQDFLQREVTKLKKDMGLVDKDQLESILQRLDRLEKKIDKLEEKNVL